VPASGTDSHFPHLLDAINDVGQEIDAPSDKQKRKAPWFTEASEAISIFPRLEDKWMRSGVDLAAALISIPFCLETQA